MTPTAKLTLVALLALTLSGSALARADAPRQVPQGLKPFLLRASERPVHEFPRTPSFSWAPVRGALSYQFQLAKSPSFGEGSVFWSSTSIKSPAVALPLALPWMTGSPYAAYARVRAATQTGVTQWSSPYGFNVRWSGVPSALPSSPGLSRWTSVEGATGYNVWFTDIGKVVATRTNAVDHREFYAFHQDPQFTGTVRWRVRAVRALYGQIPTGIPAASYGPWSPVYTTTNPALGTGPLKLVATIAGTTTSTPAAPKVHEFSPAYTFSGTNASTGATYGLYRVYVFSDRDCVNVIYRGAIVGSPAYAPRTTGPLDLPKSTTDFAKALTTYLKDGTEGKTFMADRAAVGTTESAPAPAAVAATDKAAAKSTDKGSSTTPPADTGLPSTPGVTGAPVDLWNSGWPNGRFFWTAVTVAPVVLPAVATTLSAPTVAGATTLTTFEAVSTKGAPLTIGSGGSAQVTTVTDVSADGLTATVSPALAAAHTAGDTVVTGSVIEYRDVELPQDACAAGRISAFGQASPPAVTSQGSPYASGLSPKGRLIAAASPASTFYGPPLVAWRPVQGASQYQVEWSHTAYPWRSAGQSLTYGTSATLPLRPGTWWYRVRGINFFLPGTARAMDWSQPLRLQVARPAFSVSR